MYHLVQLFQNNRKREFKVKRKCGSDGNEKLAKTIKKKEGPTGTWWNNIDIKAHRLLRNVLVMAYRHRAAVTADADLLSDKTAVIGDIKKGTFCTVHLSKHEQL